MSDINNPIENNTPTQNLGEILQDVVFRTQLARLTCLLFGKSLTFAASAYISLILILALSMRFVGEQNLSVAFILYLPRIIWLLPLPVLLLLTLIWQRKLFVALLLTASFFTYSVMGYRLGPDEPLPLSARSPDTLTILSYNRGQHASQSLQPFKNLIQPDLLVMQEAGGRAARYAKAEAYQEFTHTAGQDEFTLLSKYPITNITALTLPFGERQQNVAARFEIDWNGTPIAIYSVHLPTPRDILLYYRRGAFLYGIIGIPGTPFGEKRKSNQAYWNARLNLSQALAKQLQQEKLPMIVVGDFNIPHAGYNHNTFNSFLQDSHKKSGSGLGYTFPGTTRNPLSLYGPWMRIDYIFCDNNWISLRCTTEKKRQSQHRAVAATLRLKKQI